MAKVGKHATSFKSAPASDVMMRHAERMLLLSATLFAVAFVLRRAFLWEIKPVSWDYAPPQNGALEAAFLLLSIQNIAAIISAIAAVLLALTWWKARGNAG